MTTITELKDRCLEAHNTFSRMQVRVGPSGYSAYWPEMPWVWGDDKQKLHRPLRFVPSAATITRANEFSGWVNANLNEEQRKLIREWAHLKTSKNATIRGYCKKIGILEHNYRRRIDEIFQMLLFTVYGISTVRRSPDVDDARKIEQTRAGSENYWRDDATFRRRQLVRDLLEKSHHRIGQ